jgi:hypothetical protein
MFSCTLAHNIFLLSCSYYFCALLLYPFLPLRVGRAPGLSVSRCSRMSGQSVNQLAGTFMLAFISHSWQHLLPRQDHRDKCHSHRRRLPCDGRLVVPSSQGRLVIPIWLMQAVVPVWLGQACRSRLARAGLSFPCCQGRPVIPFWPVQACCSRLARAGLLFPSGQCRLVVPVWPGQACYSLLARAGLLFPSGQGRLVLFSVLTKCQ